MPVEDSPNASVGISTGVSIGDSSKGISQSPSSVGVSEGVLTGVSSVVLVASVGRSVISKSANQLCVIGKSACCRPFASLLECT